MVWWASEKMDEKFSWAPICGLLILLLKLKTWLIVFKTLPASKDFGSVFKSPKAIYWNFISSCGNKVSLKHVTLIIVRGRCLWLRAGEPLTF